jgi:hypothetical protein
MRALLAFLSVLIISPSLLAQQHRTASPKDQQRQLKWQQPQSSQLYDQHTVKALYFEGAAYNGSRTPVYYEKIKAPAGTTSAAATLIDPVYEPLTAQELSIAGNSLPTESPVTVTIGYQQKQSYALIEVLPFRKSPSTGKFEKLVSFQLDVNYNSSNKMNAAALTSQTYAASSVLAQGDWYRIGVTRDGVYKINYDFLKKLGIDMSTLNPHDIRLYGNGGGQLPYIAGAAHRDDLTENAIYVAGESDNSFDKDDYILFYGESPNTWNYNPAPTDKHFHHQVHLFSDTTYYFITAGVTAGKRIATQASVTGANTTVTSFDDYAYHENDLVNLVKSGREWYGESFEILSSYAIPFSFPNIDPSVPAYVNTRIISSLTSQHSYTVSSGSGSTTISIYPISGSPEDDAAEPGQSSYTFTPSASSFAVNITKNNGSAKGWLDYVEVNARRMLSLSDNQMLFRDMSSVAAGNISQFNLSNAGSSVIVWDVTDPTDVKQQSTSLTGSTLQFTIATDALHEFIAFTGGTYFTPTSFGRVENQNLHAMGPTDMIIVCHPSFLAQANILADLHRERDSMDVIIVTPQQIYNEFSSGMQDIAAIRNFTKMFYDRASTPSDEPRFLLLFGDGSYDNKNRFNPNSNYIPTFESQNSISPVNSYVTDDYYANLDDSEGNAAGNEFADIGVGRFPVRNTAEATAVVNKIIRYTEQNPNAVESSSSCTQQGNATGFGDWRNIVCFIADDQDGSLYVRSAEQLAAFIDTTYNNYNIDKIYLDAYPQVSTPGGERYPEATEAFIKRVDKGALIVNYIGHGGEVGLAHERLLEISNINNWRNLPRLPLFLTATCEFSRYDDPERTSAGEYCLLNPDGGGIAMLTTVRLVYNWDNIALCTAFYNSAFQEVNGRMHTLGEMYKIVKNDANGTTTNGRKFALLGDPALTLAYPKHIVKTDSINSIALNSASQDTIKALSIVRISGHIEDKSGSLLNGFNGILYPTVYDKTSAITTLSNNGPVESPATAFGLQKNVIYKGKVSVTNGHYSFTFVVPKDVAFQYGPGRISYYVQNGTEDGSGYYEKVIVGGSESLAGNDNKGPEVSLYMNDSTFVTGGITNESPDLFAKVKDPNGINTVGSGIGHDIMAVLDENTEHAVVLNDYYEADLNSYKSGSVRYPFTELSEGNHSLSLKVWDVYNNSSQSFTDFVVARSSKLALNHVLNYPNPFTTKTQFYFEHNQCCDLMDVQIQVFTVSGKLVKTIQTLVHSEGFRSEPIDWDGTDDFGDKIGRGVYVYRVKVRNSMGESADTFEKLVILN